MKKIAIFVLGLILALSLCACACNNMEPATTPSTTNAPTTNNTIMPTDDMTIPVPETNIPDRDIGPTTPGTEGGSTTNDGTNNGTNSNNAVS